MELRILGPLEAVAEGRVVDIRGQKQRELLAILAVHANEVVSADRLIDELWGESPPASAVKTLQAYVSRLRKTLGGGSLTTHGHGYSLALAPGELDAERFATLLEEGRRALAAGEPDRAAGTLDAALALWRGPALADFTYASFAQPAIARLDELRLAAREERVEADLARGRHAEVIGELEQLVAQNPLRERPRAQLMLALYRSGRQAEALQVYQEGRRTLAEELGLEPSQALQRLERQILEHDPALAPAISEAHPVVATRSRRRLWAIAAAALLLVVLGAGVAIARAMQDDAATDSAGAAALDPETGEILESVALGTAPGTVAIGEGSVWVLDADDKTVSQIDPESREVVRTFSTSSTPTDIAVGAGAVWIGNAGDKDGLLPQSVSRLDPESGLVIATIDLPPAPGGHEYGAFAAGGRRLAVSPEAVWVINPDRTVSRIDPRSNRRVARIARVEANDIAVGEGDVWITEESNHVTEIDTGANAVRKRVLVDIPILGPLAVGGGAVWVTDLENGKLWRISGTKRTAIELDTWVGGVSFGAGAVWVTNEIADTVYRIDPTTNTPRRIGGLYSPRGVAAGDGAVWVTTAAPPSRAATLPDAVCSDVYYERDDEPDVLLVSDLTLKGDARENTQPMVDAMRSVLEQRGFEAGAVTVGYQSCDNATAQAGGLDFFRCAANAKAYTRNLRVVAVFGSFASPCSYAQIPITNAAEDGPLAMLSPSNTYEGLTTDDDLYPTGSRSFFRMAAPGSLDGSAQVQLANELGHDRIYLLTSKWEEYASFFDSARSTAKRLDVDVVGQAVFDHEAESYADLVREIARKRPGAIAIGAVLTPGSGALVRNLHAALGPDVPLLAPDGFRLIEDLVTLAGPATKSLYVSEYGIANDKLPPRGRQFLDAFAATREGDPGPDLSSSYGAQGAEILLDAIARSDGTRASVMEEIRRTRVENGILGDIAFSAKGDLVDAPFTFYRVEGERFVADRVVVVRRPTAGQ